MSERDGRLTVDGDRAVLNFERRLPFPIEVVWSAITDPVICKSIQGVSDCPRRSP
jgi:hypothetical protein